MIHTTVPACVKRPRHATSWIYYAHLLEDHCHSKVCCLRPIKEQGSTSDHTPIADDLEVLQVLDDSGSAFKMRFQKLELLICYATLANSFQPLCFLASAQICAYFVILT